MNKNIYAIIRGGMGNQMFQYAHAVAVAAKHHAQLRLIDCTRQQRTSRSWALSCFGVEPHIADAVRTATAVVLEAAARKVVAPNILQRAGVQIEHAGMPSDESDAMPRFISGYWQSEQCFGGFQTLVRSLFRFPPLRKGFGEPSSRSVAIHFRRGDYVSDRAASEKHLTCNPDWYRAAWETMKTSVAAPRARVFSDDPNAARRLLQLEGDVTYVDTEPSAPAWVDMAAMSECQHFIISNSTYSWWAAYLSDSPGKLIIAPQWWFRGVSTASLKVCPPEWQLM